MRGGVSGTKGGRNGKSRARKKNDGAKNRLLRKLEGDMIRYRKIRGSGRSRVVGKAYLQGLMLRIE